MKLITILFQKEDREQKSLTKQKKNKILSVQVKEKSYNSPEGLQLYPRDTPTQVFSCEYSKNFRDSFFDRTAPVIIFEVSFSIRTPLL